MPQLAISQTLWDDLKAVAQRLGATPHGVARQALGNYVKRQQDEGLLVRASRAGHAASFRMEQTENVIRQYRNENKRQRVRQSEKPVSNTHR
jgi:predicted transcriptional regulator